MADVFGHLIRSNFINLRYLTDAYVQHEKNPLWFSEICSGNEMGILKLIMADGRHLTL